ncbi:MAG TPA: SCO1664 family protein [Mycobacteriales bacterium]|nr:SCO1664 family protein [Mycobacteriales bacterium]
MTAPARELGTDDVLRLLREGELSVQGQMIDASNATLYCEIALAGVVTACVYKPVAGERPLWDFPDGTLAAREVAAYAVSAASGWDIVPPTVMRDGPYGPGMCQLWINADESVSLEQLVRSPIEPLRRMAVFDAVINNADRKGGHLLPMPDGHVYGIDHGVCFSVDDKLRTVLWGWRGQPLTDEALDVLSGLKVDLAGGLGGTLEELLTRREVEATRRRVNRLLETGRHPQPSGDWPPMPWPPF